MSNTSTLKSQVNKELKKQRELSQLSTPEPEGPGEFPARSFELGSQGHRRRHDSVLARRCSDGELPLERGFNGLADFLVAKPEMVERLSNIMTGKLSGLQKSKVEEVHGAGRRGQTLEDHLHRKTHRGVVRKMELKLHAVTDFLNEQDWFQQLKAKWEELDPQSRGYLKIAGGAATALLFLYLVLSSIWSVHKLKKELSEKNDLLMMIQSANDEMHRLRETARPGRAPPAGTWTTYFEHGGRRAPGSTNRS